MIVVDSESSQDISNSPQIELEKQVSDFISKISEALRYYALGETVKEIHENQQSLRELQLKLTSFSKNMSDSEAMDGGLVDRFARLYAPWKEKMANWKALTSNKLKNIGLTFEEHIKVVDGLTQGDISQALKISRQADLKVNQSMPMWSIAVVQDAMRTRETDDRRRLHEKVMEHFFQATEEKKETEPDWSPPELIIQAGLPGSGKTSSFDLLKLRLGKVLLADLDEIRIRLYEELRGDNELFTPTENGESRRVNPHRMGYNESDQAIVLALNPEAKDIRDAMIRRAMERGISVVLPGTLKTPANIQEVVTLAKQHGYRVRITHVCIDAAEAWMRNVTRRRSVPLSFFLSALRTYDELAHAIEGNSIAADEIDIIQTGGVSPYYLANLTRTFGRFLLSETDQALLQKLQQKKYFTF